MGRSGRGRAAALAVPAALALSVAGLSGCATKETRVVRVIGPASAVPHPWIGRDESLVLEAWGRNPQREPDGDGGSILSYRERAGAVKVEASGTPQTATAGGTIGTPSGARGVEPPSPFGETRISPAPGFAARFWIDAGGTVYRVWFSPSVYRDGKDAPPSGTPASNPSESLPVSGRSEDDSDS